MCWLGLVESDAWHGEWKWIKGHKPLGTKDAGPLLTRVDVGRIMTWYEYRTRAEQEGGEASDGNGAQARRDKLPR